MEDSEIQKYIDFIKQHLDLDRLEKGIIKEILKAENRITYADIAGNLNYCEQTIRDKAYILWRNLTKVFRRELTALFGCDSEINKANFLERIHDIYEYYQRSAPSIYVRREPIETKACEANIQPASLIRIKAPQKMGKTLLLKQILKDARVRGFKTVICDFGPFETFKYVSYALLLKTFCSLVIKKLQLAENERDGLLNIISNEINSNDTVASFFEAHILPKVSGNLVLALENFDNVFEKNDEKERIGENFCRLLKYCYDAPSRESNSDWDKLHLIIIHSTDIYGQMDINVSPLAGVGKYFELKVFNAAEIQELFNQYKLSLNDTERNQIIDLLDGHPYLLTSAVEELLRNQNIEQFLEEAHTEGGIFRDHLRRLLDTLNRDNNLREAYKKVVNSDTPVDLLSSQPLSFKLYSMGLIKLIGNRVSPSCNLYRNYFQEHL